MKPGYKSSEFLLTTLASALSWFMASGIPVNNTVVQGIGIVGGILSALGYSRERTKLKVETSMVTGLGGIKHGPGAKRKK